MFKNYLKIALRQLRKQKFYSAIKIGGFALGIATCLLIALFIRNELSYDRDYPDAGRIYRVTGVFNDHGTIKRGASWQAPLAAAIKNEIPGVEQTTRLMSSALFWGGLAAINSGASTRTRTPMKKGSPGPTPRCRRCSG